MNSHLSQADIKDYLENRTAAGDLLAVDDHLSDCDECALQMSSAVAASELADNGFDVDLYTQHLSYDSVEAFVNGMIDPVDKEIAAVHLERCRSCSESLNDLVTLRQELIESSSSSIDTKAETGIWQGVKSYLKPSYLIPAFGLVLVGIFAIWSFSTNRTASVEQATIPTTNELQPPANEPNAAPSDANSNQPAETAEKPPVVASINDDGTSIELYSDGKIEGLGSPQFEVRVRNALARQEIAIGADAGQFSKAPGVLMGSGADGVPFALTSPVAKVIETANPRFVWKPLAGAELYQVEIFDENFNRVASSPTLKNTAWQIDKALPRGKVYAWQVTAIKDGTEVKSPVRPAPDAKFKVLSQSSADSLAAARRSGSKLVLGILYAEAGMLPEAEQEFARLLRANPDSAIVRSLLQKVRSAR